MYAVLAALLWGLDYSLTGQVLQSISLPTLLAIELLSGFVLMTAISLLSANYSTDLAELVGSKRALFLVCLIVIAFNCANSLIVLSIGAKNPTVSSLVEISYPLFVAGFSWVLFRQGNLNFGGMLGGGF